jgi:heme oxygenase
MTTLKELTWPAHKRAEQTELMHALLKDSITHAQYVALLCVKYEIYAQIEQQVKFECAELYRATATLQDLNQLNASHTCVKSSQLHEYLNVLAKCDSEQIWGHVYVHYLAPVYGGQIIKKIIQHRFPVLTYEFQDVATCVQEIRQKTHVGLAPAANLAFEHTEKIYSEIWSIHS